MQSVDRRREESHTCILSHRVVHHERRLVFHVGMQPPCSSCVHRVVVGVLAIEPQRASMDGRRKLAAQDRREATPAPVVEEDHVQRRIEAQHARDSLDLVGDPRGHTNGLGIGCRGEQMGLQGTSSHKSLPRTHYHYYPLLPLLAHKLERCLRSLDVPRGCAPL